jgi:hypothetical protein
LAQNNNNGASAPKTAKEM